MQGEERKGERNVSRQMPMGLKYSDNVLRNAASRSRAITQLASGTADRGLGAGCRAPGAAGGEESGAVIDAFPSDVALSKQLRQETG